MLNKKTMFLIMGLVLIKSVYSFDLSDGIKKACGNNPIKITGISKSKKSQYFNGVDIYTVVIRSNSAFQLKNCCLPDGGSYGFFCNKNNEAVNYISDNTIVVGELLRNSLNMTNVENNKKDFVQFIHSLVIDESNYNIIPVENYKELNSIKTYNGRYKLKFQQRLSKIFFNHPIVIKHNRIEFYAVVGWMHKINELQKITIDYSTRNLEVYTEVIEKELFCNIPRIIY